MKISKIIRNGVVTSFLLLIIANIPVYSQNKGFKQIQGKVLDEQSKKALVFATLTVEGSNISTITNTEGEFLLKIPVDNKGENITISFLGYTSKTVPITSLKSKGNSILLASSAVQLSV